MINKLNRPGHAGRDVDQLFTSVYRHYFDILYNYGIRIAKDEDLVKDGIQELFFRIWKNHINLLAVSNLKTYLLKGLRNQIINILELKNNKINRIEIEDNISVEFSPEDYYINNQLEDAVRKRVLQALNKLSKKQREAIYLRYFEELEYDEIAEIMNINIQSVKNNLQRSYPSLKIHLQ